MKSTRNRIIYWCSIAAVMLLTIGASSAGAQSLGGQLGLMLGTLIGFVVWIIFITAPITGLAWVVSYILKQQGLAMRVFHVSCAGAVSVIALAQFAGLARLAR